MIDRRRNVALTVALLIAVLNHQIGVIESDTLRGRWSNYLYAGNALPVVEYMQNEVDNNRKELPFPATNAYSLVQFYDDSQRSQSIRNLFVRAAKMVTEKATIWLQHTDVSTRKELEVFGVSCTMHPGVCEKHGAVLDLPLFVLYPPFEETGKNIDNHIVLGDADIFSQPEDISVKQFVDLVVAHLGINKASEDDDMVDYGVESSSLRRSHTPHIGPTLEQLQNALHIALDHALRNVHGNKDNEKNMSSQAPLSDDQKIALKEFLALLKNTLPSDWPVANVVQKALQQFRYVSNRPSYLYKILDASKPSGDQKRPSFWVLIHSVTVLVVDYNEKIQRQYAKNKIQQRVHLLPTLAVSRTLRNFIKMFGMLDQIEQSIGESIVQEFTQCESTKICPNPYYALLREATSDDDDVLDWIQLPLYWADLHRRLLSHQQTWPSRRDCPQCWDSQQRWQEHNVFRYLQLEYSSPLPTGMFVDRKRFLDLPIRSQQQNQKSLLLVVQSSIVALATAVVMLRFYLLSRRKHDQSEVLSGKAD